MKQRPILFSAPMVRALLEGRKTQTRRIVKPQPHESAGISFTIPRPNAKGTCAHFEHIDEAGVHSNESTVHCPHGMPGDRLWVRESFKRISSGTVKDGYGEIRYGHAYKADGATEWNAGVTIVHDITGRTVGPMQFLPAPWKPSIHMPRRASRILLEITGISVERLQDISEEDALAEGITVSECLECDGWANAYSVLWESINGDGSWDVNPWVWVVEFKRIES